MARIRNWRGVLVVTAAAAVVVAAVVGGIRLKRRTGRQRTGPPAVFSRVAGVEQAALVPYPQPADKPGKTPFGVSYHRPTGLTSYHTQVQFGFTAPVVPLTNVTDTRRREVLSHITLSPRAEGTFRLVGGQAVVFSPKKPFPAATQYTVTVSAGLKDVSGRALKKDFTWKFHTPRLRLSVACGHDVSLQPRIDLSSNGALNVESLKKHIECYEVHGKKRRKLRLEWKVTAHKWNPPVIQESTRVRRSYSYVLTPYRRLKKHTRYLLKITPGTIPASGNLPDGKGTSCRFSTYAPLKFTFSSTRCGDELQYDYWIMANNELEAKRMRDAFHVSSPLKGDRVWGRFSHNTKRVWVPDEYLEPDTDYTLTIDTKVRDVFGQRLSKPWVHKFHTAHLKPNVDVREGTWILSTRTEPALRYRVTNPRVVKTRLLPLPENRVLNWVYGPSRQWTGWRDRDVSGRVMEEHRDSAVTDAHVFAEDVREMRKLSLTPALGRTGKGLVIYELEATEKNLCRRHMDEPQRWSGAVLRTNIGVHTDLLPTGMEVWALHLHDGSPVVGGEVKIYRYAGEKGEDSHFGLWRGRSKPSLRRPVLVFRGKTDRDGRLHVPAVKLKTPGSTGNRTLAGSRGLAVFVHERDDVAFVSSSGWFTTQFDRRLFGFVRGWEGPKPVSLGEVFSDRGLYQPTEDVKLKGIVRFRVADKLQVPRHVRFAIDLVDPRGKERSLGTVTTDEFGTFSLTVKPKPGEPLGFYTVEATAKNPPLHLSGSFRRAEFRPPRYEARLTTDRPLYLVSDTILADARADYLFGSPVAGGTATFRVSVMPREFEPKGWNEFRFSLPDWLRKERNDKGRGTKYLVEKTTTLDDQGRARLRVPVVADDVPEPMEYSVEVAVRDVSGQSVGASTRVAVLPHPLLIGVRTADRFTTVGTVCRADVIVTDPAGKPQPGVKLRVECMSVRRVAKKAEGLDEYGFRYVYEHEVVATRTAVSAKTPVSVTFMPAKAGDYLIVARFAGRKPTGTEGGRWLYVSGTGPFKPRDATEFKLQTDKDEYRVGDKVTVMIPSMFDRAKLLLNVEREKIFAQEFKEVRRGVTTFTFRVTDEMIPNVYVQATLSELGPKNGHLFADENHKPYRLGVVEISVSRAPHALTVKVSPRDSRRSPGQETVVNCRVKDARGAPAAAQLTVMVVDDAILRLTGYRPPNPLDAVWVYRPLSARIWDNRPQVVVAKRTAPAPSKGWGYGGGLLHGGIDAARVRKDFRHLAYFNPNVRTDSRGYARCSFKLPDNLTTWRVLVTAVTRENDFGFGEATFVVNQPLLLQGLLPRFARVDDSFTAGVSLTNRTGVAGTATVRCTAVQGRSLLKPGSGTPVTKTVPLQRNGTRGVRFPKTVVNVGECVFRFDCKFSGRDAAGRPVTAADRLELPLVVRLPGTAETVGFACEVPGRLRVPVRLTDAIRTDLGSLNVSLSSTAFGNLTPDVDWLLRYPYNCAEQRASRLLGLLAVEEPAKKFGLKIHGGKPVKQLVEQDLQGLLNCQRPSGGFAYWPGGFPQAILSAQVAVVLAEARRHGYQVPQETWTSLLHYLKQKSSFRWTSEQAKLRFWVLQAVAVRALGDEYTDHYEELMTRRNTLPLIDRVRLDLVLQQSKDWTKQAAELYDEIKKHEWITAETAHLEEWQAEGMEWFPFTYMDSRVALAALGLKLDLLVAPRHERVAKMARYLWHTRENRRWRDTYGTARVIDALCRYVEVREAIPPRFTAGVSVGRLPAKEFRFYGYKLGQQEAKVPLAQLGRGEHMVVVEKEGRGTLYSTLRLTYLLKGKQPPQCQGFSLERAMVNLRTNKPVKSTADEVRVGDVVRVKLVLGASQDAWNVVVEAPVPAGFEPVHTSFDTIPNWMRREATSTLRWRPNPFTHREFHHDHVALFAADLRVGVYEYEYLLQAVNPGTFTYPPVRAYRMYEPQEFGTTESGMVRVTKR